jgi:endonuclease/exonuclease/phosphatase family metal-dependent hydrolase
MVFSNYTIQEAKRYELPIETGLYKLLDLDRCYSKNKISVDGGRELVLYNFHLSAYTSDGTIATEQLKILVNDMEIEYNKGNYIIAGGDFNKDLLIDSSVYFGKSDIEYTWAQPMDETLLNAKHITKVAPLDEANPVPSCRNADGPYHVGQYVLTIDGFLVTQNVEVMSSNVINTNFKYSDHNPVYMTFKLI